GRCARTPDTRARRALVVARGDLSRAHRCGESPVEDEPVVEGGRARRGCARSAWLVHEKPFAAATPVDQSIVRIGIIGPSRIKFLRARADSTCADAIGAW